MDDLVDALQARLTLASSTPPAAQENDFGAHQPLTTDGKRTRTQVTPSTSSASTVLGASTSFLPSPPSPPANNALTVPVPQFAARRSPALDFKVDPLQEDRYYTVVVGKCTGVFYDKWYKVECLVSGVPASVPKCRKYKTEDKAIRAYAEAKKAGIVKVVRDPGDDKKFGPLSSAEQ
ncbi:hypothetical protein M413DRAFT_411635 [Hebeloma cylindrosporum]|uniref:Ribonuclease H1 N-terminal domain-containing protein n=1 Tax=Hebeloma cylindrosporum TaxID=76867 RepID=A0A0C2YID4_HEBCY|nr:hypothetical protein M413DRAFT_411635 [Hebeloma cylindrosporum h7]